MLEVIGIVGSIASIVALALPASTKSQRFIHAAYVLLIVAISTTAVSYKTELSRINSAEKSANALIKDRRMNFTDEGFNMAALSFLEKYKDLYPDSYSRASELCKNNGCLKNQHREGANSLSHVYSQINVSSALEGMVKGIGAISAN